MAIRITLTFSGIPQINDFVQLNDDLVGINITETFVANRTQAQEVTIGSTIEETINNFVTAFNDDFDSQLNYDIQSNANSITISFSLGGDGTFNEDINSDVIDFVIDGGAYFDYFTAEYTNSAEDNFKLLIKGQDINFIPQKISAYADLSYKDVDNILEPVRGSQLDITVNASIERPFDLFLDFKENDFLAEFYRNDILIFKGFINPEGVTQSFTSKFWKSQLTAVDNIAVLKNTSLPYKNELPTEHVLLDMCLKQTGLDLPIAFYDDINLSQRANNSNATIFYGKSIWRGDIERIVDPLVFKNNNGRFVSCKKVLEDILNKYNAILFQQSIEHENGIDLCWVFFRPSLYIKTWDFVSNKQFPIVKITDFTTQQNYGGYAQIDVPQIEELGRANPITKKLGTKDTRFQDAFYKNSNQLIRQNRALQNFRFTQNWIDKNDYFGYNFSKLFLFDNFFSDNDYVQNSDNKLLLQSTSFLASQISNFTFTPSVSFGDAVNAVNEFVELPDDTIEFEINGKATLINTTGSSIPGRQKSLLCAVYQVIEAGPNKGVYICRPAYENNTEVYNPQAIEQLNWFKISDNVTDSFDNPEDYSDLLFLFFTNEFFNSTAEIDFNLTLPPFLQKGGKINVFLGQLHETNRNGGSVLEKTYQVIIDELKVNAISPSNLGEGEFHDALNNQDISSKLEEPLEVINADEDTNFFRNGLKFLPGGNLEPTNYNNWTTIYNVDGASRLLEITSVERIKLFAKSQNVFSGDIGDYLPYFCRIQNQAYSNLYFMFSKWIYRTAENTIEAELREVGLGNPSVTYENSIIFEDEENRLIE